MPEDAPVIDFEVAMFLKKFMVWFGNYKNVFSAHDNVHSREIKAFLARAQEIGLDKVFQVVNSIELKYKQPRIGDLERALQKIKSDRKRRVEHKLKREWAIQHNVDRENFKKEYKQALKKVGGKKPICPLCKREQGYNSGRGWWCINFRCSMKNERLKNTNEPIDKKSQGAGEK